MLLAIDIGNSRIKFGVFDDARLISKFSIPTIRDDSPDWIRNAVGDNLPERISSAIVCSVVPQIEAALRELIEGLYGVMPTFVNNSFDFGLTIKYEPPDSVGTDRLVNAFSAVRKYGKPCIVCSFGTATTVDAVNSNSEYLGGIIAPGMNTLAEALHLTTSKLPKIEIEKPDRVIGNTTVDSIQSGIFYGYIGLVEGILTKMTAELLSAPPAVAGGDVKDGSAEKPTVIATGGFAQIIADECDLIEIVDESLTLEGLKLLLERGSRIS